MRGSQPRRTVNERHLPGCRLISSLTAHPRGVTPGHTRRQEAPGRLTEEERRTTVYEIRIAGIVGDELAPYVENMTSEVLPVETVLRGEIADQAALHGMLDQVQALGLELIEIRALPRPSETSKSTIR